MAFVRRVVTVLYLALASVSVAGALEPDEGAVTVTNPRDAALAGPHIAHPGEFSALYTNPAGLVRVEPQFSLGAITVRLSGPVFSLAGVVAESAGGDLATMLGSPSVQSLLSGIYASLNVTGPVHFGYAGDGMGFAVINDSGLLFRNVGATQIEARFSERFMLVAGFGFRIPLPPSLESDLALGIGLKGFVRGDAIVTTSLIELPTLASTIGPDTLTGSPFDLVSGIGLDAGVLYRWRDLLGFAVTVENIYTPTATLSYDRLGDFLDGAADPGAPTYRAIPQDVSFGVVFTPDLGPFEHYVRDLSLMLDYRDALDFWLDPAHAENFILKIGLGVEAKLLQVLSVRAGFGDGLFAAGLGIDMSFADLSVAMYGTELSAEPGLLPLYNLVLGLEFHR